MNSFNVFLDTNIFIKSKYDFTKGPLATLKKYCERGIITLFTNEIILFEVRHHIANDVKLLAQQAKNSIKEHKELINAITLESYNVIEKTLLSAPEKLNAQFDSFMDGSIILSNENLSIIELFNDYFHKHAPFEKIEKKKAEFPDATAIMSIKHFVKQNNSTIHVITDDNGWHDALNDIDNIFLYKTLKDLLTEIAKLEELYTQIAQYMGDCVDYFSSSIHTWFCDHDWSSYVNNIEMCIECNEIDDMSISAVTLIPDGIEYIDKKEGYAVALFSGIATLHLTFPYTNHTNEVYDREDHVWYNTIYGNGSAEISVSFTGSATILIYENGELKFNSPDFEEINLGGITVLDYELTPYRENDFPYFDTCPDCGKPIGIHNDGGNGFCTNCALRH